MEKTPPERIERTKDGRRQTRKAIGQREPPIDPLVKHVNDHFDDHREAMKRLGHPATKPASESRSDPE